MFLDKLFGKKRNNKDAGSKLTIKHDEWDFSDWSKIVNEMRALSTADDRLSDFTPTGHEAMTDTFFSLYKAMPKLEDEREIRPSYMVNHFVMGKAMELKEYAELRTYSTLDLVASGMACVAMEPELEVLFDKLKDEQEMAQKMEEMLQQMEGLGEEGESVEQMLQNALAEGDDEAAQNFQDQKAKIQAAMEALEKQLQKNASQLKDALNAQEDQISQMLSQAMDKAKDEAENVDSLSTSWGLDPGTIKKMSAEKRIELAKRINNEKFRKIAELIGPMQRLAFAEQSRKLEIAREEVYDLELGSDIQHVLPEELLYLTDDEIDMLFFEKFYNDNLIQFKLRGTEKVAKGNIIFCEDGSGSMSGANEQWAKAVGLALLQIAKSQNRGFLGIHFCGPGVWKEFDFEDRLVVRTLDHAGRKAEFDELGGVLDYAETFMAGGTCFMTPLSRAIDKLTKQFDNEGKIKGDIVFCTDGQAGVPDEFLKKLAEERDRTGFRIFGIVLGGEPQSEPINTICDGRVFTVKDLISGKDISNIFRDV